MMKITLLFGGTSRESLVTTATSKAISSALPHADIWFWSNDGQVFEASKSSLMDHENPFERAFVPDGARIGSLSHALDVARDEGRVLVLGLHGGEAENGELQAMCEARGVAFTGSGSASSHLAFDKDAAKRFAHLAGINSPQSITIENAENALEHYAKLIAKPAQDGSSFGLFFINCAKDLEAVRLVSRQTPYVIEPFISGVEATCGVMEQLDGNLIALPPVEILPAQGAFDYAAKYLSSVTQEICPARFAPDIMQALKSLSLKAHRAMSCSGYSRSDFIISKDGPIYLETNTLPGLTSASLYPKSLKAQGIEFTTFLNIQIELATKRAKIKG